MIFPVISRENFSSERQTIQPHTSEQFSTSQTVVYYRKILFFLIVLL